MALPQPAAATDGRDVAQDSADRQVNAALENPLSEDATQEGASSEPASDMPLPTEPRVIFLGGLFVLAALAAAFVARDIILPLTFAVTLKLLFQPVMRVLERMRAPRIVAALSIILILLGAVVMLGAAISGPAAAWAAKLPEGVPKLQQRLGLLREPIDLFQQFVQKLGSIGDGHAPQPSSLLISGGSELLSGIVSSARGFVGDFFTTILFLYFLLLSGDTFLRRLVEILPRFSAKRQAVDISLQVEDDISAYLVTITIMNALVGLATAIAMQLTGVGDPILWASSPSPEYAPIIGPTIGMAIFLSRAS